MNKEFKVDELIEALREHITKLIIKDKEKDNEIAEKTKALAELITARVNMDVFEGQPFN